VSLRPNVWFDGPVALLDELYVQPHHRSAGIGTALLAAVREEAQTRDVEHIEINVDEGDVDARRFYERNGFTAVDVDSGEAALYYSGPARWNPADLG
jgi:GNAT superfamily N-acetyltransferase